jgi:hypothetical protein
VSFEYLDLADYLAIAEEVTGLDVRTLVRVANLDLADSALHAPLAGFGEKDLYEGFVAKAAILLVRLAKNHPVGSGIPTRRSMRPNGRCLLWLQVSGPMSKRLHGSAII